MFLHFNSHLRQEGTQMESKTQDRHRKVECDVCNKPMRYDRLKRHKKTHKDSLLVSDSEIKDELENRQEIRKKQEEEKIQKVVEIVRENNLAFPEKIVTKKRKSAEEIDDVRARCLQNQKLYLEKIELGKQVASMVESGEVMYESLEKIHKNSFDTYRKYLKVERHS